MIPGHTARRCAKKKREVEEGGFERATSPKSEQVTLFAASPAETNNFFSHGDDCIAAYLYIFLVFACYCTALCRHTRTAFFFFYSTVPL